MHTEEPQEAERLKREAIAWVVRITSGAATEDDAARLARWRASDANHEAAYRDAVRLWKASGPALQAGTVRSRRISRRSFLGAGAAGASMAAGVSFASYLGLVPSLNAVLADYATPRGQQQQLTLEDGSIVDLDGGSTLSVAFSENARSVTLHDGAALFTVAHDRSRPFTVSAAQGRTTAIGTTFAVRHGTEDVEVECLEGEVRVECVRDARLSAGDSILYTQQGLGAISAGSPDEMAAWRRGLLVFRDRSLDDVVLDINRHRKGRVVIARDRLGTRRVSGVFHLDRPDEIIAHLEATLQLSASRVGGGVVLLY
ncbi:FecR family protein [Ensifer sp.]|jgi:transmembrane sensor|uniref:FecR family protein n=1 Tax=Ensifer sp. TaxID=1872086 RepID=UPI002E0DBCC5|nr:FecR family protein [Ensifer sp.]